MVRRLLTIAVVSLAVGAGVYLWQHPKISDEKTAKVAAERQASKLKQKVRRQAEAIPNAISQSPKPGWKKYFPGPDKTSLAGKSISEVTDLLGEPPVLVREAAYDPKDSRQVWVFRASKEDATGIYLFLRGGKVVKGYLDEFNGLPNSAILDDTEFWFDPNGQTEANERLGEEEQTVTGE